MESEATTPQPKVTYSQLVLALSCVLEACDRVSADPASVVRWSNADLVVISAARSILRDVRSEEGGAP